MKRKIELLLSLFVLIAILGITSCEDEDSSEYENNNRNPSYTNGY